MIRRIIAYVERLMEDRRYGGDTDYTDGYIAACEDVTEFLYELEEEDA